CGHGDRQRVHDRVRRRNGARGLPDSSGRDRRADRPGFLAGSLYEIDPGKKLWPYHLHHANEEWLVVLRGRPTLRTPDGERELAEGDVACFPRGAAGTHQLRNNTEEPARILMLSSSILPDIVEYPDSGKFYTL